MKCFGNSVECATVVVGYDDYAEGIVFTLQSPANEPRVVFLRPKQVRRMARTLLAMAAKVERRQKKAGKEV